MSAKAVTSEGSAQREHVRWSQRCCALLFNSSKVRELLPTGSC